MKPWGGFFDVVKLEASIETLEKETPSADFWTQNKDTSNRLMQELKQLRNQLGPFQELGRHCHELLGLLEITDESDKASLEHLEEEAAVLEKKVGQLEFQKLLSGPNDHNHAILSINAGAGGTESCDWVSCCCACTPAGPSIRGTKYKWSTFCRGKKRA